VDNAGLCERLQRFFAARGVDGEVADIAPIVGGFSQITYRFTVRSADGQQAYVLRMDRMSGETLTSTDRALEAKVIAALNNAGAPVPLALWADPDGDELGAPTLISEFVEGQNMLQAARSGARDATDLVDLATRAAAEIHGGRHRGIPRRARRRGRRLEQLPRRRDRGVARDRGPAGPNACQYLRYLASWLDTHRPEPVDLRLVHGEFSLANLMLRPDGEVSVIDWEYAHIGDPRMDFGWCIQRGARSLRICSVITSIWCVGVIAS